MSGSIDFIQLGVWNHKSKRVCLSTHDDFFTVAVTFYADIDRELCRWEKIREGNRDDPAAGVLYALRGQTDGEHEERWLFTCYRYIEV